MKNAVKKMVVLLLALMMTVSAFAYAETDAAEPVTLHFAFLNEWSAAEGAALEQKLQDVFYKENPNITVELDMIPYSDYKTKVLTAHATGTNQYDLFFVDNSWTSTMAQAGALADMTELVGQYGINIDDYFPGFLQNCMVGDAQYAIPFETDCRMLAYNKAMFADAGLEPPTTMEEFLADAEALTTDDTYGFVTYTVGTSGECMIMDVGSVLFQGNGGSFVTKDGDNYVASFDSEAGVQFLTDLRRLSKCMPKDITNYDYSMFNASFATGKAAMAVYGPWIYTEQAILDSNLDYGLTLMPEGSVSSFSAQGGWLLGVSADTANMDATMKLVEFLSRPEINADVVSSLSPMNAAYQYGKMVDPKYQIFGEQLKSAAPAIVPGVPGRAALAQDSYDQIIRAILTDDDVHEIAKDVNTAIQSAIDAAL